MFVLFLDMDARSHDKEPTALHVALYERGHGPPKIPKIPCSFGWLKLPLSYLIFLDYTLPFIA